MGSQGTEDTARTKTGLDWHLITGALGLARMQRKMGRKVPICRVLNTKEPINSIL